jgi:CubicO group peptidase (beta-lactamase class C family)
MRKLLFASLAVAAVAIAATQHGAVADLFATRTAAHHLNPDRLGAIRNVLQTEVDKGVRAGFVAGVVTRDGETYSTAVGLADRETSSPMTVDTRFRIASMTKPIVTAAVMQLAERGVVSLDDPVSKYIPAFANARVALAEEPDDTGEIPTRTPARAMTIHDLLTHTSGIGYLFNNKTSLDREYLEAGFYATGGTLAERVDRLARIPLYNDPGAEWRYSYSIDVAGLVIEVATGQSLEDYLTENFFAPLGMKDTEFLVDQSDFDGLATVYQFDSAGNLERLKADANGFNVNDEGFGVMSGGAGLVSTLHDYLRFCEMMLRGGELDGARVLSASSVKRMLSDNLQPGTAGQLWERKYASFGLGGVVVTHPELADQLVRKGEWGWSGFWDTWFVIDPADGLAVVLLAQTQPGPNAPPSQARQLVKEIVYGAAGR